MYQVEQETDDVVSAFSSLHGQRPPVYRRSWDTLVTTRCQGNRTQETLQPSPLSLSSPIEEPDRIRVNWDTWDTEKVYAFALPVLFLCATACCAFSCALRNVGAFSHGLARCTISFLSLIHI